MVVAVFEVVAAFIVEFDAVCAKAGAHMIARAAAPRRSVFVFLHRYPRECGSAFLLQKV